MSRPFLARPPRHLELVIDRSQPRRSSGPLVFAFVLFLVAIAAVYLVKGFGQ